MSTYITLAEAKTHLRVDFTDDDIYIQSLCDLVEELVATEIQGLIPGEGYVTTNGTTSLVGDLTYFTDYSAGDIIKVDGETTRIIDTITDDSNLTVTSAFTSTNPDLMFIIYTGIPSPCPLALKHAMLLMVGHFYMLREPVIIGVNAMKIPYAFDFLIAPYKNWTIA